MWACGCLTLDEAEAFFCSGNEDEDDEVFHQQEVEPEATSWIRDIPHM